MTEGNLDGRQTRQPVLGCGLVLLLSGLTVLLTWPVAARLDSALFAPGDPLLTTWVLAWDLHALAEAPLRLFDANLFHPHRRALAYTDHLFGLVPFALPAHLAGASPLAAHNLVWLATFPLSGLAMFALVRYLSGSAAAATVAAVLYAFAHYRYGQLGHVQLLSHQWLPLFLLGLHRAVDQGARWRDIWLATVAGALQTLASVYYGFATLVAGLAFAAWVAAPAQRPPLGRLAVRVTIAATATSLLLLLPVALPYRAVLGQAGHHAVLGEAGLVAPRFEVEAYSARPSAYLAAPEVNRWLGEVSARFRRPEAALFPGLLTLALAGPGLALAFGRRGRSLATADAKPRLARRLDLLLAVAVVIVVVNALIVGGASLPVGPARLAVRSVDRSLVLVGVALLLRRLVRGRPAPLPGLSRLAWPNTPGLYVLLVAVGALVSFGPTLHLLGGLRLRPLYRHLEAVVPGFGVMRVPARFGVLVTTGIVVLAGLGLASLLRRLPSQRLRAAVTAACVVAGAGEAWAVPLALYPVDARGRPADAWLARAAGPGAVVVLPVQDPRGSGWPREGTRLFGSTRHWRPLVNGYAGRFPKDYPETVATLNTFPAPGALARLRELRVRFVVVELSEYPREQARGLAALEPPPGVTRVATLDDTLIFEVEPPG